MSPPIENNANSKRNVSMAYKNLEEAIQASGGNIVKMMRQSVRMSIQSSLRNSPTGATSNVPGPRHACYSIRPTTW
jgi:hypothetical protein